MGSKILVVDDEETILKLVSYNLEKEGFQVITASDGSGAWEKIQKEMPGLIILDVMLPGMDGFTLCRRLRQENVTTPVLMLTAKGEEADKVLGLEFGADDYMTKPFSPRELTARVKAILRRTKEKDPCFSEKYNERLEFGELVILPGRYEVMLDGKQLFLTPKEFELLVFLARNQGLVLDREYILKKVWGYDFYGDTRVVDVHISHLREKIERNPSRPRFVKTIRGVGYKFQAPDKYIVEESRM